jgi:hypothetical protein
VNTPWWRVGLPFAAGAALLVLGGLIGGRLPVIPLVLLVALGALWTYGAWRAQGADRELKATGPVVAPGAGQWLVVGRARRGLRRGFLVASTEELLWVPAPPEPWSSNSLVETPAQARAWPLFPLAAVETFSAAFGAFGGAHFTLNLGGGRVLRLKVEDDVGAVVLLGLLAGGSASGRGLESSPPSRLG